MNVFTLACLLGLAASVNVGMPAHSANSLAEVGHNPCAGIEDNNEIWLCLVNNPNTVFEHVEYEIPADAAVQI